MLIVSDTGPLRYLIELAVIDLLPKLYGSVVTTPAVIDELQLSHFPKSVIAWAAHPPAWLEVAQPKLLRFVDDLELAEASALSLGLELRCDVFLVDERKATSIARANGISTAGTLAVLIDAGLAELIDFRAAIRQLTTETRFRSTPQLIAGTISEFDRLRAGGK